MSAFGVCLGKDMATLLEPLFAGVVVDLFHTYILGKFDPLVACSTAYAQKDDDECTSSSGTSVTADTGHVHVHF